MTAKSSKSVSKTYGWASLTHLSKANFVGVLFQVIGPVSNIKTATNVSKSKMTVKTSALLQTVPGLPLL